MKTIHAKIKHVNIDKNKRNNNQMNIIDMEDLIIMYEAYQKQEKVYNLLYGDLQLQSNRLFGIGYDDGIFGAIEIPN